MADDNPDEWDFDDPRFLLSAEQAAAPASAPLTYAERRKRDLAKAQERMRLHQHSTAKAGRREREEEARLEGLATNLMAKEKEEGRESKAMRMMRGMGFKPGQSLGKQDDGPVASTSAAPSSTGSTPTASPAPEPAPPAPKPRTEPITFQMRERRTGLGVPSSRPTQKLAPEVIAAAAAQPLPSTDSFVTRMRSGMDGRRAHGLLRSARRTCEELDRRAGVEASPMWRDPDEEEAKERKAKRRKVYDRADGFGEEDEEAEEEGRRRKGALGYETGLSGVVVDEEEESEDAKAAREEEEDWFSMDTATRLGLTLAYLRRTYSYCLWCGCAYDNKADLDANCPGEDEDAH